MISKLSQAMIKIAIRNDIITEQERELYEYSYETMFARILSWGTLFVIGLLFNCIIGVLAFFFTFMPLRAYAGGFHARGYTGCYLASVVAFVLIACIYEVLGAAWVAPFVLIGSTVSGIIIFCRSPIEDPNKPLDEHEIRKYRENARLIVSMEFVIVAIASITALNQVAFFMGAALMMEAVLLLIPCSQKGVGT